MLRVVLQNLKFEIVQLSPINSKPRSQTPNDTQFKLTFNSKLSFLNHNVTKCLATCDNKPLPSNLGRVDGRVNRPITLLRTNTPAVKCCRVTREGSSREGAEEASRKMTEFQINSSKIKEVSVMHVYRQTVLHPYLKMKMLLL